MTVGLFDESPGVAIPRIVASQLAASADLIAFFGSRIWGTSMEDATTPLRQSALVVTLSGEEDPRRQTGGRIRLTYVARVAAYLPIPTPAVGWLTIPAAPTAGTHATGSLTGTFGYRLTEITDDGESFASPALAVTVTSKWPQLTLPAPSSASVVGWRVWRTEAGRTAARWAGTAIRSASTWTDSTLDAALGDELAPVRGMREQLANVIRQALYGQDRETLPDGGYYHADAALRVDVLPQSISTRRNMIVYPLEARYPAIYDPEAGELAVGVAP